MEQGEEGDVESISVYAKGGGRKGLGGTEQAYVGGKGAAEMKT